MNETTNRATTMMTMMKGQARVGLEAILVAANANDEFPIGPAAIDEFPLEHYASTETLRARSVADAIGPERNASLEELELAWDCDAVVRPMRSNCLLHEWSCRDCGEIVPGRMFRA